MLIFGTEGLIVGTTQEALRQRQAQRDRSENGQNSRNQK